MVEKVEPLDPEQPYPSLITGKRACPPEDCGGVHGYLRLLEDLADPRHEEHLELREWAGAGHPSTSTSGRSAATSGAWSAAPRPDARASRAETAPLHPGLISSSLRPPGRSRRPLLRDRQPSCAAPWRV